MSEVGFIGNQYDICSDCPLNQLPLQTGGAEAALWERDRLQQEDGRYIPRVEDVDTDLFDDPEHAKFVIGCLKVRRADGCPDLMTFIERKAQGERESQS